MDSKVLTSSAKDIFLELSVYVLSRFSFFWSNDLHGSILKQNHFYGSMLKRNYLYGSMLCKSDGPWAGRRPLIGQNMFTLQTSADARFPSTSVHRLVYCCPVQQHNWAKHSVCTTSLGENALAHSILLGSKNVRK